MTYAIVETGGKQMRVEPGRFYDIELLHVDPDESYSIDKVLLVHHDDDIQIGQPFVEGAIVEGTVVRHFRGRKVIVYKMRPKKKTRKKRGHRQEITRLMINSIKLNGSILAEADISEFEAESPNLVPIVEAEETLETEAQSIEEVEETVDVVSEEVEIKPVSEVEDATEEEIEEPVAEAETETEASVTEKSEETVEVTSESVTEEE